jgi:hypothetical protein
MRLRFVTYVGAAIGFAAPALRAQGGQSACLTHDANAEQLYQQVVRIAMSSDSVHAALRATLGIPLTTLNQIGPVNDSPTCGKVASAINSTLSTPKKIRSIHLLRVGTTYAAMDPAERAGEWRPIFFFDESFRYRAVLAGS